jgi:hypothetical protein
MHELRSGARTKALFGAQNFSRISLTDFSKGLCSTTSFLHNLEHRLIFFDKQAVFFNDLKTYGKMRAHIEHALQNALFLITRRVFECSCPTCVYSILHTHSFFIIYTRCLFQSLSLTHALSLSLFLSLSLSHTHTHTNTLKEK